MGVIDPPSSPDANPAAIPPANTIAAPLLAPLLGNRERSPGVTERTAAMPSLLPALALAVCVRVLRERERCLVYIRS